MRPAGLTPTEPRVGWVGEGRNTASCNPGDIRKEVAHTLSGLRFPRNNGSSCVLSPHTPGPGQRPHTPSSPQPRVGAARGPFYRRGNRGWSKLTPPSTLPSQEVTEPGLEPRGPSGDISSSTSADGVGWLRQKGSGGQDPEQLGNWGKPAPRQRWALCEPASQGWPQCISRAVKPWHLSKGGVVCVLETSRP